MSYSFKVSEINDLFESIQRDINELIETKEKIPKGREYSSQILDSISREIQKLEERKNYILNMEIKLPEEILPGVTSRLEKPDNEVPEINIEKEPLMEAKQPPKKNKPIRRY